MGDIADDLINQMTDIWEPPEDDYFQLGISSPSFTWWIQDNGEKIAVSKMSESHLTNSIKMIKRRGTWRQTWLEPLETELKSRKNV